MLVGRPLKGDDGLGIQGDNAVAWTEFSLTWSGGWKLLTFIGTSCNGDFRFGVQGSSEEW
jgi:hypothetical protein